MRHNFQSSSRHYLLRLQSLREGKGRVGRWWGGVCREGLVGVVGRHMHGGCCAAGWGGKVRENCLPGNVNVQVVAGTGSSMHAMHVHASTLICSQ